MEATTSVGGNDAARSAIRTLGGPTKAAKRLGIGARKAQTIQAWLRTRVPAEWCPLLEEATREVGVPHLCEDLRPDVAWRVLRANPLR